MFYGLKPKISAFIHSFIHSFIGEFNVDSKAELKLEHGLSFSAKGELVIFSG